VSMKKICIAGENVDSMVAIARQVGKNE
jgi:hypothetical protein